MIVSAGFQSALARDRDPTLVCIRQNLIGKLVPELGEPQNGLLDAFDAEKLSPGDIEPITNFGTYRVTSNGKSYVVRLPRGAHSTSFEKFASDFIQTMGGLITPKIRLLDSGDTDAFVSRLPARDRDGYRSLLDRNPRSLDRQASVSMYLGSFQVGKDYLGTRATGFSREGTLRRMNALPFRIRQDLFDLWTICEVLGVSDFHFSNWLVYRNRAVAIDLGYASQNFVEGSSTPRLKFNPFGLDPIDVNIGLLRQNISPPLRRFLEKLGPQEVEAIARQSGFHINDTQIQGIIRRAKSVLLP